VWEGGGGENLKKKGINYLTDLVNLQEEGIKKKESKLMAKG